MRTVHLGRLRIILMRGEYQRSTVVMSNITERFADRLELQSTSMSVNRSTILCDALRFHLLDQVIFGAYEDEGYIYRL